MEEFILQGRIPAQITPFWTFYAAHVGIPGIILNDDTTIPRAEETTDGDIHFLSAALSSLGVQPSLTDYEHASYLGSNLGKLTLVHQIVSAAPDDEETCARALPFISHVAQVGIESPTGLVEPIGLAEYVNYEYERRQETAMAMKLGDAHDAEGLAQMGQMALYGRSRMVTSWNIPVLVGWTVLLALFIWLLRFVSKRTETSTTPGMATPAATTPAPANPRRPFMNSKWGVAVACAALAWAFSVKETAMAHIPQAISKNETEATSLYREASEQGHIGSTYALAILAVDEQDFASAETYLRKVLKDAPIGDPMRAMAEYFTNVHGLGVEKNETRAMEYLREAAHMDPLAMMLYAGKTTNRTEQIIFYQYAAAFGNIQARYNTAVLLYQENHFCESYRSFADVAYEMEPVGRTIFALSLRAYTMFSHHAAALGFAMLARSGNPQAAINAAELLLKISPQECDHVKVDLVHVGQFCCPGDDCDAPQWAFNVGNKASSECLSFHAAQTIEDGDDTSSHQSERAAVRDDERNQSQSAAKREEEYAGEGVRRRGFDEDEWINGYVTTYDTQWCQFSTECKRSALASDTSAKTYRVTRYCCLGNPLDCVLDIGLNSTDQFIAEALERMGQPSAAWRCLRAEEVTCALALARDGHTKDALKKIRQLMQRDDVNSVAVWATLAYDLIQDVLWSLYSGSAWDGTMMAQVEVHHPWFFSTE
eukprot:GEMP01021304.1.p1 GENE.GEMP01021304.1~~GEMP01021304.1.p1  ORF type:complete len:717 (+),score=161.01 GEMP01021304.1:24-2153(+)